MFLSEKISITNDIFFRKKQAWMMLAVAEDD